jgi:hypothetical protein
MQIPRRRRRDRSCNGENSVREMNEKERQLVDWLADTVEDDALALAKRMLLEEGVDCRTWSSPGSGSAA